MDGILQVMGVTTGLGLGVTFAVLICIIIIILVYPKILGLFMPKKKKQPEPVQQQETPVQEASVQEAEVPADDLEKIAAIAAAIVCCTETQPPSGIVVRSVKKLGNSAWRKAGRKQQNNEF